MGKDSYNRFMSTNSKLPQYVLTVLNRLNEAGFEAYCVGGAVRDLQLGLTPKDFDVATAATPAQVAEVFPQVDYVGAHFGVSLVEVDGFSVEVATFRSEASYSDSRHPDDVKFETDPRKDAERRDFTVNALFMSADEHVLDFVGGLADIESRTLNTVGNPDDRFAEDPLRMLRAVRFAVQKGFTLSPSTWAALKRNAALVKTLSKERVSSEMTAILTSGRANHGLYFLLHTGLLEYVMPDLLKMVGCEHNNPKFHPEGDVWTHTLLLLRGLEKGCSPTLAWAALLHDVGKYATRSVNEETGKVSFKRHAEVGAVMTEHLLRELRFGSDFVDTVVSHVNQHMKFFDAQSMSKSTLMRFVRQDTFAELLELHRLDVSASNGDFTTHRFVHDFFEVNTETMRPARFVNGNDLVALGFKPGPSFKLALEHLENLQLEGTVTSREQALEVAKFAMDYVTRAK